MIGQLALQILVVLVLLRLLTPLFRRLGQPAVVLEIAVGLALGPSLLGALAPRLSCFLFPPSSLPALHVAAQLGLVFYMFTVGLEFDLGQLRGMGHAAVVISYSSIVVPFGAGLGLALLLHHHLAPAVPFWSFALFTGAAMSITAFPVLTRILASFGLDNTPLGTMATAIAAVDDVTAWCLLAFVSAVARAESLGTAAHTTLAAVAFVALMLGVVKSMLELWADAERESDIAISLCVLFFSAWVADGIGLHAIFGGFVAGVVIPRKWWLADRLREGLELPVEHVLLPLFFVYSGLRTELALLSTPAHWLLCLAVIATACVGKYGGAYLAALTTGSTRRDAAALGVLVNTRGLMELVALNLGLDLGVVPPALFAMLVVMALVTTAMTAPCLRYVLREP